MIFLLKSISKIPFSILYLFSDFLFFLAYYVVGYRKKVVLSNLQNSFPEKNKKEIKLITKGFYRNLADVIVETLKVITISRKNLDSRVKINNKEVLYEYIAKNESVIVLTGHQCNWEWLFISGCSQLTMPIRGIYKFINNPTFENLMLDARSRFGEKPIEMQKSFKVFVKRKNIPTAYGMIADQSPMPNENNLHLTFLNQDTPFFRGPDRFAKILNFNVVFWGMKRIKRGYYEINLEKISEPPYKKDNMEILEKFRDKMEDLIKENPSDWLWSHKRWKHGRKNEKTKHI